MRCPAEPRATIRLMFARTVSIAWLWPRSRASSSVGWAVRIARQSYAVVRFLRKY